MTEPKGAKARYKTTNWAAYILHRAAHACRPFVKAEEATPKAARSPDLLATRFIKLIGKLYRAEARATQWSSQRRGRLRQRYSASVVAKIEQLLLVNLQTVAPTSLLGEALHYLHGQWPKLVRFLDNGTWPLDSNPVENAIRPFVVGRRNAKCAFMRSRA